MSETFGPTGAIGGSGGADIEQRGATGPPGSPTTITPRRRPAGLAPQRGRREMKEYPLTDSDLHNLRNMGAGAALCFSAGSICLGVWSNIITSMTFASDVPKELVSLWAGRQTDMAIATVAFYAIGVVLVFMGYTRVEEIKSQVEFSDGSPYRPKRWLRVVAAVVIALFLIGGGYWLGKHT